MNESTSRLVKTVSLQLPPGDPGPICPYPPRCSPTDISRWRQATFTMTETALDVPRNQDRELIEQWIKQLIQRELTVHLEVAEKEAGPLVIQVDDAAAEVIRLALQHRTPRVSAG